MLGARCAIHPEQPRVVVVADQDRVMEDLDAVWAQKRTALEKGTAFELPGAMRNSEPTELSGT
jgi:hypothetical protein